MHANIKQSQATDITGDSFNEMETVRTCLEIQVSLCFSHGAAMLELNIATNLKLSKLER